MASTRGLVKDGAAWMSMIASRIKTVHTYDEELANEIASAIVKDYHPLFIQLQTRLQIEYLA
jgi:hypothetical protein